MNGDELRRERQGVVVRDLLDEIERLRAALSSVLNPPPWHELRYGPVDEWNRKASEYAVTLSAAHALLSDEGQG